MADVDDRWHRTVKDDDGEPVKVRTARYGQGKRWVARWRDDQGQQRKKSFAKKVDAERHAAKMAADLAAGSYIDPRAGRMTLREYATQRWLPAQLHLRRSTYELYESHLRNHVYPSLGERRIGALRRSDMKAFVATLPEGMASSTKGTVYSVLRAVMASAVDDGLIPANPCLRVPLPRVERTVVEPLSADSVLALADAIDPRYRLAVLLGAGVGLRVSEALGLTSARVEFLRRRIHVEEQLARGGSGSLVPLKTRASRRIVPMDDLVAREITEHMRQYPPGPSGLLLTRPDGRPLRYTAFSDAWRAAVKATAVRRGTRFHELRHFYASTLIAAGLHPKAIQVRLGHATISETMDTYGHLFPNSEDLGRGAIDAALTSKVKGVR